MGSGTWEVGGVEAGREPTQALPPSAFRLPPSEATQALPPLAVERRANDPLHKLRSLTETFDGRVLVLAESAGRRETMLEYFGEQGLAIQQVSDYKFFLESDSRLALTVGPLHAGFALADPRVAIVTENELYAQQARTRRGRDTAQRASPEGMLRDLSEIKAGDPVVHETHGIGRYQGLVTLDLGDGLIGQMGEFLLLEYAEKAKLYVPVSGLHLISRYSGAAPDAAPLHQLGSGDWDKAKKKAAKQVRDTAAELLELYAQRASRQGHAFGIKTHDYEAFAEGFPFE